MGRSPKIQSSWACGTSQLAHQIQRAGESKQQIPCGYLNTQLLNSVAFFQSINHSSFLPFFFQSKVLEHMGSSWHFNPESKCLNKPVGSVWRGPERPGGLFCFHCVVIWIPVGMSVWHLEALILFQSNYGRPSQGSNWE